jgi:GT2 family glycosyltransferase
LARCIASVRAQTVLPDSVIVLDNASVDGSVDRLEPWERLTVLWMDSNLGFAAGNNRAIAACSSEYVALLNPDAFPAPDWIERLLDAANAWPQAASFGSRQLSHGHPGLLDGVGDCYHVSGLAWREAHGFPQTIRHLVPREIFAPCAAAALYRRDAVTAAGGFDETYFCYFEDVDLGFRLRLAGHSARYVPDAVVEHIGGASSGGERSDFAIFHGHRNLVWAFVKNMPAPLLIILLPLHLLMTVAVVLQMSLQGHARTALRSKWHAVLGLPAAWRARRVVQRSRRASWRDVWRALDKRALPRPRG